MSEILITVVILFILLIAGFITYDLIQTRRYTKRGNDSHTSVIEAMYSVQDAMARDKKYIDLIRGYSNQLEAIIESLVESLKGFDLERQVDFIYGDGESKPILTKSEIHQSRYVGEPIILLPLKTLKSNIDAVIEEWVSEQNTATRKRVSDEMWATGLMDIDG